MDDVIIAKPALAIVITAINDLLPAHGYPGVFVSSVRPNETAGNGDPIPKRFVRITRVGGGMRNMVTDDARMLIECWSDDSVDGEILANTVRGLLASLAGTNHELGHVRGVGAADDGPTQFPDPLVPSHERWQFQVSVMVSTN